MNVRKNLLSLSLLFATVVAILSGCVSGAAVRQPSATPTVVPTASPTPTPTVVPGAGVATVMATGPNNVFDVAQDDTFVYYTVKVAGNGFVYAVSKSATTTTTSPIALASSGTLNPWGVTCDPGSTGFVYFTDSQATAGQGSVFRVPKPVSGAPAGPAVQLATGLTNPTFIRLNDVVGGDGLLYTAENVTNTGRILRFNTTTLGQTANASVFVDNIGVVPVFNMHTFTVNGAAQLWFTLMASDLSSGQNGQVRFIPTATAGTVNLTSSTLVATGLLNPTDLWLQQAGPGQTNVLWTEFDTQNGSVRRASITDSGVRGTAIGVAPTSVANQPPASIKVNQAAQRAYVTRNAQQVNGGGFVLIDLVTDVSIALTVSDTNGAGQTGGTNFPFQFVGDAVYGLFNTEFNYTDQAVATNPSNLVRLGFPITFSRGISKTDVSNTMPEERFEFRQQ